MCDSWSGDQWYSPQCGGHRWLPVSGMSVSLSFTGGPTLSLLAFTHVPHSLAFTYLCALPQPGAAIAVNFIIDPLGAIAQIAIDGTNIAQVDTGNVSLTFSDCVPAWWISEDLLQGPHTITFTGLTPDPATGVSNGVTNFRDFVYAASLYI